MTTTMEPLEPTLYRRNTLTNSAAEFVETRAGPYVLNRLLESGEHDVEEEVGEPKLNVESEFVVELDGFAPKGIIFE
jgi:hypothetical protein